METRDKLDDGNFPSTGRDEIQLPKSCHNHEKFDHGPIKKKLLYLEISDHLSWDRGGLFNNPIFVHVHSARDRGWMGMDSDELIKIRVKR